MKRVVVAAAVLFLSGEAVAQEACLRPVPPVFPAAAAAATMSQADLEAVRATRDAYFTAADANLSCMDRTLDARMNDLFATGAPMDAATRALGRAHEDASRERGVVYERFVRLCLAWEDARQMSLPGGCAPAQ
jgi:hypothetical protein